jgi:hypothetical protein
MTENHLASDLIDERPQFCPLSMAALAKTRRAGFQVFERFDDDLNRPETIDRVLMYRSKFAFEIAVGPRGFTLKVSVCARAYNYLRVAFSELALTTTRENSRS